MFYIGRCKAFWLKDNSPSFQNFFFSRCLIHLYYFLKKICYLMGSQFISQIKEYCNFFYKYIFTHPYVYVWIGLCFISVFLNAEVSTIEILLNLCIFHLIHFLEIFFILFIVLCNGCKVLHYIEYNNLVN